MGAPRNATLAETIYRGIEKNEYLNRIYADLLYNYSLRLFSLRLRQKEVDIGAALRFADILSKSAYTENSEAHKIWAQEIVILLNILYPDDSRIKPYLGSVLSAVGNYRGLMSAAKDYSSPDVLDRIFYGYEKELLAIPGVPDAFFFPAQKIVYDGLGKQCFSYSGPTSMGKSFVVQTYIKQQVEAGEEKNYAILVPTKALINEVRSNIIKELNDSLKERNYRVVASAGDIVLQQNHHFVFVMTPERMHHLLNTMPEMTLDFLFVDEAHKISAKGGRSAFYYLDYIRVPGCVYAALSYDWAPTVQTLHDISANKWVGYAANEKQTVIGKLEKYMAEAIDNIAHPLGILKDYIAKRGLGSFSDEEYADILQALPKEPYSQTEHSFKVNLQNKMSALAYTKKVKELTSKWQVKTETNSVSEWMTAHIMPIAWVLPQYNSVFTLLSALDRNERVDVVLLENAISDLDAADLSLLDDSAEIDKCFIQNVASEKYYGLLLPHVSAVKSKIQNGGFQDYTSWGSNIVNIRKMVEKYIRNDLKSEVSDKAKKKVDSMNDIGQLKEKLNKLIEQSPEACLLLLDD